MLVLSASERRGEVDYAARERRNAQAVARLTDGQRYTLGAVFGDTWKRADWGTFQRMWLHVGGPMRFEVVAGR